MTLGECFYGGYSPYVGSQSRAVKVTYRQLFHAASQ